MVDVENKNSKVCSVCQERKLLDDFQTLSASKDGKTAFCRECDKKRKAAYYKKNREKILADKAKVSQERNKAYYWKYRDKELERIAARKNRKLEIPNEPISRETLYKRDEGMCYLCGEYVPYEKFNEEHIIPLSRLELGPTHTYDNLGVACISCNKRKGNRTPEECAWVTNLRPKALIGV